MVDSWLLLSKLPARLVCHWLKGNVMLVLCNNVHETPGVPFVAEIDSPPAPLKLMLVMRGVDGGGGGTVESTVTGPKKKSASPR